MNEMKQLIFYRKDKFEKEYKNKLKMLDKDINGQPVPIYKQVYKLNGLIYNELDICRCEGIDPKFSECYKLLLKEGKERFEKHGYIFAGRIFIKKSI